MVIRLPQAAASKLKGQPRGDEKSDDKGDGQDAVADHVVKGVWVEECKEDVAARVPARLVRVARQRQPMKLVRNQNLR